MCKVNTVMYSFKKIHTRIAHRSIGEKHRLITRAVCFPSPSQNIQYPFFPLHPDQFFGVIQDTILSLAIPSKDTICTAAEVPWETAVRSGKEVSSGLTKRKSSFRLSFKKIPSLFNPH